MEEARTHMERKPRSHSIHQALPTIAIIISLVALALSAYAVLNPQTKTVVVYRNATTNGIATGGAQLSGYNISSALITPPSSFADSPVITANQTFGNRLTNINAQFNASELSAINNAPDSYFETAGQMYLNHSLKNNVGASPTKLPLFIVNGKPTVIYLGSITCIFCAENRWAMMLALSRFGSFSALFKGYSAIADGDLPTIYWAPAHYNSSSTTLGASYESNYVNFISIEDANPISKGFSLNPISAIQKTVNQANNLAYSDAMQFVINTKAFGGTPFTVWGAYQVSGADAVIFGNATPTSSTDLPLQRMTHEDVINQLRKPSSQFAWSEYAAADFYVAMVCKTIGNTAPVCSLQSIKSLETGF